LTTDSYCSINSTLVVLNHFNIGGAKPFARFRFLLSGDVQGQMQMEKIINISLAFYKLLI